MKSPSAILSARRLLAVLSGVMLTVPTAWSQTGQLQFVNGSPYPESAEVDVYLDGALFIDDLAYGDAIPYTTRSAGSNPSTRATCERTWPFNRECRSPAGPPK